jgi:hypothetical protein
VTRSARSYHETEGYIPHRGTHHILGGRRSERKERGVSHLSHQLDSLGGDLSAYGAEDDLVSYQLQIRHAREGLTIFLISVLLASVSDPSENARHCSKTLKRVTNTALEALLPLNPTKFWLSARSCGTLAQIGFTYHRNNPIPFDQLAQIFPELKSKHLSRNTPARETILDDKTPFCEILDSVNRYSVLADCLLSR